MERVDTPIPLLGEKPVAIGGLLLAAGLAAFDSFGSSRPDPRDKLANDSVAPAECKRPAAAMGRLYRAVCSVGGCPSGSPRPAIWSPNCSNDTETL